MRVEPHGVGSFLHITQRGTHGIEIVRDVHDRERFVRSLFYLNDTYTDQNWHRRVAEIQPFGRPTDWPERNPLVDVIAWTLLANHFHLFIKEIQENGTAKFMQRLGGSVSMCFNTKYKEKGRLFQSSYHARSVDSDEHYRYLAFYILVKNVLDMYPGGLSAAQKDFDDAWEWARRYSYSSFRDITAGAVSPIISDEENLIGSIIGPGDSYKQEARELLDFHIASKGDEFKDIMLEPW